MHLPEIFLLLLIVIYFVCFPKIFERAGEDGWKGYVPFYNFITWIKILKRPWWWFILLLVPGVNLLVLVILNVETSIAFNKRSAKEQWFAGALPWVFFPQLAFKDLEAKYVGPRDWKNIKKSMGREWGEAILFAVIAASVIRTFFLEAFTIPTPSMEGSMLVGDYLFVSKVSYGARVPETPMSIPFVHNVIPGTMTNSYVNWFSLPKWRLPGFGNVERYDAVVFNFPHGDTILIEPKLSTHDYYAFVKNEAVLIAKGYDNYIKDPEGYKSQARDRFANDKYCISCASTVGAPQGAKVKIGGVKSRPTDKQDNYVKRCIGLPGEVLEIKNKQVHIDGEAINNPSELQYTYIAKFKTGTGNTAISSIAKKYRMMYNEIRFFGPANKPIPDLCLIPLTNLEYEEISRKSYIDTIYPTPKQNDHNMEDLFPNVNNPSFTEWSNDDYGPVFIPEKGAVIELNKDNLDLYRRVINIYEENELVEKEGKIFINGVESNDYTFKQDYYWMMGDNRHNSADSRVWGFVPENHVVGKAVFTWFSKEKDQMDKANAIRWGRMFKRVGKGFED